MEQDKLSVMYKPPIVVALDVSYYSTGVALFNSSGEFCLGLITSKTAKNYGVNIYTYSFVPIRSDPIMIACQLANQIINIIDTPVSLIAIEDLAYGMYRSHDSAQFLGVLQYLLRTQLCNDVVFVPPTSVKKFAVGNGRATKDMIVEQFRKETNIQCDISDVVDAYYIGKYVLNELHKDLKGGSYETHSCN